MNGKTKSHIKLRIRWYPSCNKSSMQISGVCNRRCYRNVNMAMRKILSSQKGRYILIYLRTTKQNCKYFMHTIYGNFFLFIHSWTISFKHGKQTAEPVIISWLSIYFSDKPVMPHGPGQVHSTSTSLLFGRGSGAWFEYFTSGRQVTFFTAVPTVFPQPQGWKSKTFVEFECPALCISRKTYSVLHPLQWMCVVSNAAGNQKIKLWHSLSYGI